MEHELTDPIVIERCHSIGSIEPDIWNGLVQTDYPFLLHGFLLALEQTGCVNGNSGWQSFHYLAWNKQTSRSPALMGALVCWVKLHSYGEYNFDHLFAQAWQSLGGEYYPKLLVGVPFTPVPGPRLLLAGDNETIKINILSQIIQAVQSDAQKFGFSSLHVNFCLEQEATWLKKQGFVTRTGHQYHWFNRGYQCFDDFLEALTSRKRKQIKKERSYIKQANITHQWLDGANMNTDQWDQFYRFYESTYARKWGVAYMTREFFEHISSTIGKHICVIMGYEEGNAISGALNFVGDGVMYGRNWGCDKDIKFLHFETCYYQAIEYAIQHKLQCVEAGTQGEHKLQRGYEPSLTWSAHWFNHPDFMKFVGAYLLKEGLEQDKMMLALKEYVPFHQ